MQEKVKRCTLFGVSGDRFIIALRGYCCRCCRRCVDKSFCVRVLPGRVLFVSLGCIRLDCISAVLLSLTTTHCNLDERLI